MSARKTALDVLIACRKQNGWSNGVLKEYIERDKLDKRDAALATRLCYGVVQQRSKLDFYLSQLLTGKVKDLHPVVRDILHLGLYQIYEMDKIPESAAVNESVALAKKNCKWNPRISGLVNAVLRNAIRTKDTRKEPDSLAVRYSHPQELVDLLTESLGKEKIEPMLIANNAIPETVVQVNTIRTTTDELKTILENEGVNVKRHEWMPDCLILSNTGNIERLSAFKDGLLYVQDTAARLSVMCIQAEGMNWQVLDCCAAPGGKSFATSIAMNNKGSVTSCDVYEHKIQLIENGARRLGLTNILGKQQDASAENPDWLEKMDVVIADVPCSGLGIIRKKPDIRFKNLRDMEELPTLQKKILNQQSKYVKRGGTLLYSTCTLLKRENEDVVYEFLAEHKDFELVPLTLPAVFPKNDEGMITLIPGEYDTDGFFICRMRRR